MRKVRSAKEDFTEQDLPATRKQVFFDCYREQFSLVMRLGFVCVALVLPAVIAMMLKDNYIVSETAKLTEITSETLAPIYYAARMRYGIMSVLTFTLFFAIFAGLVRIIRQFVWREPVFWKEDFAAGLKNDSGRFALVAFFVAVLDYIIGLLDGSVLTYIFFGIFVGLILPVMIWTLLQTVYYKIGFFGSLKNGILYYLKTLPVTLLLVLVTVLPFWLITELVPIPLVKYLAIFLLGLVYIVPITMIWLLFANKYFDEILNKKQYPSIYRRGLRPLEEDTDEATPEEPEDPEQVQSEQESESVQEQKQ